MRYDPDACRPSSRRETSTRSWTNSTTRRALVRLAPRAAGDGARRRGRRPHEHRHVRRCRHGHPQRTRGAAGGETVTVGEVNVVPVPDAAHYANRPAGDVFMPSSGEWRVGAVVTPDRLRHICEVCGRDEILTPAEAFDAGWDYPPKQGVFGVISPRCCPDCPNNKTVWWALMMDGFTEDMLSDQQHAVVARILDEPGSIMVMKS